MGGHGWGTIDDANLISAVHEALNVGVNFFDTADVYGLGKSEELLGKALAGVRHEAVIATKGGVRRSNDGKTFNDSSPSHLRQALDLSLGRLGVDHVDLYQLHNWDERTPIADIIEAFERMRADGKINYYGFSNLDLVTVGIVQRPPGLVSFTLGV